MNKINNKFINQEIFKQISKKDSYNNNNFQHMLKLLIFNKKVIILISKTNKMNMNKN